jgi:LemA protein
MVDAITATLIVIGGIIIVGIGVWGVRIYNRIVSLEEKCEKAWSDIDVLLKQRSEELPNLIDTVEEYMDYEEDVLKKITEARTQVQEANSPKEEAEANSMLENALGDLFAVAEDYPDLKANESFQQLQERISSIEEQISDRREFYNEAVRRWNTLINQIPYLFVANAMNKEEKEMFEAEEEEKENVDISESFSDS